MKQAVEKTTNLTVDLFYIDMMLGCAFPEAEQGLNLGRVAAKMAGFPDKIVSILPR